MSRARRLFELLGALRARRTPMTALDLSRELTVSPRTVYRDIEALRTLGAPLDGQAGVGYLLKEGFFLPDLAFSPDESDALMIGLGWVRERGDPALARAVDSALSKILSARRGGTAADDGPPRVAAARGSAPADPPLAAVMRDAIRRQRKVAIRYQDAQARVSDRIVWPIALVYFEEVRVLAAWCEDKAAFRHFRVDRIRAATIGDARYPERRPALMARWRQQDPWQTQAPDRS